MGIDLIKPITLASNAKGQSALFKRVRIISGRYGLTPRKMDLALRQFSDVLQRFNCKATFPITAVTLNRHRRTIAKYMDQNIEFAVHGYTHVDYAQLAPAEQLIHLQNAREIFNKAGIVPGGFRSPYLRRDHHLSKAIEAAGFSYVSNQPILWDVLDNTTLDRSSCTSYDRAVAFYNPWRAGERLSLPHINTHTIEIPVSLPDDEILIDRLNGSTSLIEKTWLRILAETHQKGELFTLQLHPERIAQCAESLSAVLDEARRLKPGVWCAPLGEIASWWKIRGRATVVIAETKEGCFHCKISAPMDITVLARGVDVDAPAQPWADGYLYVKARSFNINTHKKPIIGLSPTTSPSLASFFHEQGYIIETGEDSHDYSYYIDRPEFAIEEESSLIAQIEDARFPLIRLGRWPSGAKSALAITGDIDAMTFWDYGLRLIGK